MAQPSEGEMGEPTFPAWARSVEETVRHHGVDMSSGLTEEQVAQQRAKYGWNELAKQPGKPLWRLVLEQFDDMLVKVIPAVLSNRLCCKFSAGRLVQVCRNRAAPVLCSSLAVIGSVLAH